MVDTPFTSFAFPVSGGPTSRTMPIRLTDVVNVKDFGAVGDGSTDDISAINAAIAKAITLGAPGMKGATVFFPAGKYHVSGPISNLTSGTSIRLLGSGRRNTEISGNFAGYIINQDANQHGINAIEHTTVTNGYIPVGGATDITIGAILFNSTWNGLINSVDFTGWTGICMERNINANWETTILDCGAPSGYRNFSGTNDSAGNVGIYSTIGGVGIYNTACLGYNVGMCITSTTNVLSRTRTEVCNTGLLLGDDLGIVSSVGRSNDIAGTTVHGHSCERCDTSIAINNSFGANVIEACNIVGIVGTGNDVTQIVGNGTTATVTTSYPLSGYGWSSGTKQVNIELCTDVPGLNTGAGVFVTGTRTGTNTFTYLSAGVGTEVHHAPLWPQWSFKQQYGVKFTGGWSTTALIGIEVTGGLEQAGFDLYDGGSDPGTDNETDTGLVLINCITKPTSGWLMPRPAAKSNVKYISCDQPAGSTLDRGSRAAGMSFADLPGQSSVIIIAAIEGMEYNIIDGAKSGGGSLAALGDIAVGGGAQHAKVRYNGTNWTVMGI